MKKIVIIGLSLTLALALVVTVAMAWGPRFGPGLGGGPPFANLTAEQSSQIQALREAYLEEAKPLWSELRDMRIGLRFAVSDPKVQPQAVLDKQRKFSALQARFENLLFSYQVKARAIFTKEQMERFPPDCPLKMGTGYRGGKGFEKGPRKGMR